MKGAIWVEDMKLEKREKTLWGGAANERGSEEEMKTSSRGGGNELQIAATFEPQVVKESKIIKKKKKSR